MSSRMGRSSTGCGCRATAFFVLLLTRFFSSVSVTYANGEAAEGYRCSRFQVTAGCTPDGKEEDTKKCDEEITSGMSGFCVCKTRRGVFRRLRRVTCDHGPFTCEHACSRHTELMCEGFRPIDSCVHDITAAKPKGDLRPCGFTPKNEPGICECGAGRQILHPVCHNPALTDSQSCEQMCADGPSAYETLGTHLHAPESVFKQTFRKMSLKHHPDKGGDQVKFNAIREAMDIVSDRKWRNVYDMGGWKMLDEARKEKMEKGNKKETTISLSLAEMYMGVTKKVRVGRRLRLCRGCDVSKSPFCTQTCKKICPKRIEYKFMIRNGMRFQVQQEVESSQRCRSEKGDVEVEIPPGSRDGDEIVHAGEADQDEGKIPGDLVFKIKQTPEPHWSRKNNHLHLDLDISLKQSLLGFRKTITHLDGRKITVSKTGLTEANSRIVMDDEGMPDKRTGLPGKLVITCRIKYPTEPLADHVEDFLNENLPGPRSIILAEKRGKKAPPKAPSKEEL